MVDGLDGSFVVNFMCAHYLIVSLQISLLILIYFALTPTPYF